MPLERNFIEFLAAIALAFAASSLGYTFRTSSDSVSASRYMAIQVSGVQFIGVMVGAPAQVRAGREDGTHQTRDI